MQTTSSAFRQQAAGNVRKLAWEFRADWFKRQNFMDFGYFNLDSSVLDGPDLLAPTGDNIFQLWDSYLYRSYTDRVIQMEWTREETFPYSVALAIADVTLNNYDNLFTPGSTYLTEMQYDNFNASQVDTTYWFPFTSGLATIQQTGGEVVITPPNASATVSYGGYLTMDLFSLENSFASIEVSDAGDSANNTQAYFKLSIDTDNDFVILKEATELRFIDTVDGVSNATIITYNSTTHRWWRIRHDGSQVQFQTSPDGSTWTVRRSVTPEINLENLYLEFGGGTYQSEVTPGTIKFDNYNTDDSGDKLSSAPLTSHLSQGLLPRRPIRLFAGFDNVTLPQFVGLTDKTPKIDRKARTATIHAEDFLSYLFSKQMPSSVYYEDAYTNEILDDIFQMFGMTSSQYELDQGYNNINFVWFERGENVGNIIKKLMEAELGKLEMSEDGVIRFRNRARNTAAAVKTFDSSNVIDYRTTDETEIINVVNIQSEIRRLQATATVYTVDSAVELAPGVNEVFFNLENPTVDIDPISVYTANTAQDGSGSNVTAQVTISSQDEFIESVKVTFDNTTGATAYLTTLEIDGREAIVTDIINDRFEDEESIAKYEEKSLDIENDLIQDKNISEAIGNFILVNYSDFFGTIEMDVKGTPAQQIGDTVEVDLDSIQGNYLVTKIQSVLSSGQFKQIVTGKRFITTNYFQLDISELDGEDVLL